MLLNAADSRGQGRRRAAALAGAEQAARPRPQRLPEPVRSMMDTLGDRQRAHLADDGAPEPERSEVRSQVGEFCQQAIGRPLSDRPQRDARRDAGRLRAACSAPGGKIDQLFQQKLAAYVDTTHAAVAVPRRSKGRAARHRHRQPAAVPARAGDPRDLLPGRQRAHADGCSSSRSRWTRSLKQFILDVDGQIVQLRPRPADPDAVVMARPAREHAGARAGQPAGLGHDLRRRLYEGPWALLRLFDRVSFEPVANSQTAFRATFDVDGRKAVFEVTASSVRNPFRCASCTTSSAPMGL